jgi:hypothetical protein
VLISRTTMSRVVAMADLSHGCQKEPNVLFYMPNRIKCILSVMPDMQPVEGRPHARRLVQPRKPT